MNNGGVGYVRDAAAGAAGSEKPPLAGTQTSFLVYPNGRIADEMDGEAGACRERVTPAGRRVTLVFLSLPCRDENTQEGQQDWSPIETW